MNGLWVFQRRVFCIDLSWIRSEERSRTGSSAPVPLRLARVAGTVSCGSCCVRWAASVLSESGPDSPRGSQGLWTLSQGDEPPCWMLVLGLPLEKLNRTFRTSGDRRRLHTVLLSRQRGRAWRTHPGCGDTGPTAGLLLSVLTLQTRHSCVLPRALVVLNPPRGLYVRAQFRLSQRP